jgi:hypothetical protein
MTVGYSTCVIADLDAGSGIVALSNGNGGSPIGQVLALLGRFVGHDAARSMHEIAVARSRPSLA